MNEEINISACGNYCSLCPRFIATKNNDRNELERIAKLWQQAGFRKDILLPEELKCSGCFPDNPCAFNVRQCEHLKQKSNCGQCERFSCETTERMFENMKKTIEFTEANCSEDDFSALSDSFFHKPKVLEASHDSYLEDKKNLNKN